MFSTNCLHKEYLFIQAINRLGAVPLSFVREASKKWREKCVRDARVPQFSRHFFRNLEKGKRPGIEVDFLANFLAAIFISLPHSRPQGRGRGISGTLKLFLSTGLKAFLFSVHEQNCRFSFFGARQRNWALEPYSVLSWSSVVFRPEPWSFEPLLGSCLTTALALNTTNSSLVDWHVMS